MACTISFTDCQSQLPKIIFGDESFSEDIVVYGMLIFENVLHEAAANQLWKNAIEKYKRPPSSRVHARELFSGHARAKTVWNGLTEEDVDRLCTDLAGAIISAKPRYLLGLVHAKSYPPGGIPSGLDKTGGQAYTIPSTEHCYVNAFIAAYFLLNERNMLANPPGYRFFLDRQTTKIKHWAFDKKGSVEKLFSTTGMKQCVYSSEPTLLDAVDLFAYTATRALSTQSYRNKVVCSKIFDKYRPIINQGFFTIGGPPPIAELNRIALRVGEDRNMPIYDAYHSLTDGSISFEKWN